MSYTVKNCTWFSKKPENYKIIEIGCSYRTKGIETQRLSNHNKKMLLNYIFFDDYRRNLDMVLTIDNLDAPFIHFLDWDEDDIITDDTGNIKIPVEEFMEYYERDNY